MRSAKMLSYMPARWLDYHMHVQVLVGAEPAAEKHFRGGGLGLGFSPVAGQQGAVGFGVDRVVRFVVFGGEIGVTPA